MTTHRPISLPEQASENVDHSSDETRFEDNFRIAQSVWETDKRITWSNGNVHCETEPVKKPNIREFRCEIVAGNNQVIGDAIGLANRQGQAHLSDIEIADNYRLRGNGTKLLNAVEKFVQDELGAQTMSMWAVREAKPFYRNRLYRDEEGYENYGDVYPQPYTMKKKLGWF